MLKVVSTETHLGVKGSITVLTRHYTPFSYKPPPLTICINLLPSIFIASSASATPTNEKKARTHRTTLYIESSYLLASDTPTKRLAMQRQARSQLVVV